MILVFLGKQSTSFKECIYIFMIMMLKVFGHMKNVVNIKVLMIVFKINSLVGFVTCKTVFYGRFS